MRYAILDPFKIKTTQGEMQLQPGQVITLPQDKALKLLNEGKIKPFCYWLKSIVNNCQMLCLGKGCIHECPHFREYWNKRLW